MEINFKGQNLKCSVNLNLKDLSSQYTSSDECIEAIEWEILLDCIDRGYSDEQIEAVLDFYKEKISQHKNWNN